MTAGRYRAIHLCMFMKLNPLCAIIASLATSALVAHAAPDLKATAAKIDELVNAKLAKEKIQPNKPASDEIFVRRVYLDVAGRIPTLQETHEFLKSSDADKREKLIDKLLAGEGYVQNFYNYWADILRMKSQMVGGGQSLPAFYGYSKWLKDSLRANKRLYRETEGLPLRAGLSHEIHRSEGRGPDMAELSDGDLLARAEILVRITHSILLTPNVLSPLHTYDEIERFARRYLLPIAVSSTTTSASHSSDRT